MSEELIVMRIWTNRWAWQAALPIALSTLNEVVAERARKMWLQGPPLLLLKRVERGNGFEACRLLVERYDEPTRVDCITRKVLSCVQRLSLQTLGGFEVALNESEDLVQRWEILASDLVNDAVKRQTTRLSLVPEFS